MTKWNRVGAGAAFAAFLGSTAIYADVTAQQVWDSWTGYYTSFGYDVSIGAQNMDGDTLVVTDAVFTSTMPEGKGSAVITVPEIRLKEVGDGTVDVVTSEVIPMDVTTQEDDETVKMAMTLRQTDTLTKVSGTPDNMAYNITAPMMAVEMGEVVTNGDAIPVKVRVALTDSSGTYAVDTASGSQIKSDFSSARMDFTVSGADPESSTTFNLNGDLVDLKMLGDFVLPANIDMNDMAAALNLGLKMTGNFTYGAGQYMMDFDGPDGAGKINASADTGKLDFAMSKEGLHYGAGGTNTKMEMAVPDMPFPINAAIDETLVSFAMPLAKSSDPAPFAATLKLVGVSVSEELWAMFDPTAQLPHDAATLIVDLAGTATLLADIFDPAMASADTPPGELNSLDVKAVQLTAAGAELTGNGAMTFDNSAGAPVPLGAIDLKLVGANALMDKLVAMGLLPQDQVMGARMMLGLFAVPTGEDELTSKIEFKKGGSIYANGQQLQ
ncbi:DUF2125 domain-containing protein [Phaeovulum sp.]|uniref:DUF2125 domain-containing protein n=1 Tax=Phaeovulum sp. TaxID=2934796 RepID=UPI0039E6205D